MSMQTPFAARIPEETRRLVGPLLPADSVYRLVGNEVDRIISDGDFLDMYAVEACPAVNPVVLALVSIFQVLEKLQPEFTLETPDFLRLAGNHAADEISGLVLVVSPAPRREPVVTVGH